jgi:hypothetical protein
MVRRKPGQQKTEETWAAIIIEFNRLRAQGIGYIEAIRAINETGLYGRVHAKALYARYTPWVKNRIATRKRDYEHYCDEAMEGYDLIRRRAFTKGDLKLAKETIAEQHRTGQAMGIYPRGPPEEIKVTGPSFFDAITLIIKSAKEAKEERKQ